MLKVTLPFCKETKNTFMFQLPEDERKKKDMERNPIPAIYIAKSAFEGIPDEVTLTVEAS